jgi:hypothetical protein
MARLTTGDTKMFAKTKTALSVAMVLAAVGTASLAWAGGQNDGDSGLGGFVIRGSTDGVNPVYHQDEFGSTGKAYGYAVSPSQKHRPSHDRR